MGNSKVKTDIGKLHQIVRDKTLSSRFLAEHFECNPSDLFYFFLQKKLDVSGVMSNGVSFFFHGYGCKVVSSQHDLNVELEFGPKGNALAFDQYTLCNLLKHDVNGCPDFISELLDKKVIALADEELYQILADNPAFDAWRSFEEEMDACVVDRYVVNETILRSLCDSSSDET